MEDPGPEQRRPRSWILLCRSEWRPFEIIRSRCIAKNLLESGVMISGSHETKEALPVHENARQTRIHSEAFLHLLIRRQLRLSIGCAAAFLVALLGLPLMNYFYPQAMSAEMGGFTLTWLLLGVVFFPIVWIIAFVFIKRSIKLEEAEVNALESNALSDQANH